MRLSLYHALRWQALRAERPDAADICFGSYTVGIELKDLKGVASELRTTRLTLTNLLQLAHLTNAPIDVQEVNKGLAKINALLGDRP